MHEFFAQQWDSADARCLEMLRIEQVGSLLPLSYMLRFAMGAWRILNDDFETKQQRETMIKTLEPLRIDCLRILHKRHFADSTRPTRMFLEAGINGFSATLLIRSRPLKSLSIGLQAYRTMDSLRTIAPQMKDVFLGLGLFQCALANEPGIIGFAIKLFNGLQVSYDSGLTYLRTCADSSFYTGEVAKEYLIQFLSPFKPGEVAEKRRIFKSLQAAFPNVAYYVFQEIDEEMAFHRQKIFSNGAANWVIPCFEQFDTGAYFGRRMVNLVRWQCAAMDSSLLKIIRPVAFDPKQSYSFYPVFLAASKLKFRLETDKKMPESVMKRTFRLFATLRGRAYSLLRKSDVNPMLREYYLWHMDDGFR
jgi:hypothetical protein